MQPSKPQGICTQIPSGVRHSIGDDLVIDRETIPFPGSILRARFTYRLPTGEELCLVEEGPLTYRLPRHAFSAEELSRYGISPVSVLPSSYKVSSLRRLPGTNPRDASQQAAFDAMCGVQNGTLALACGKGKTVLALMYAAQRGVPVLIVAPQHAHLENWETELRNRFTVESSARVGAAKNPWPLVDVAFATVQGLARAVSSGSVPRPFWEHYGLVVFDECHHMSARHFALAVYAASGDRLGLTATVRRADAQHGIFLAHIGPVFYEDTTQELTPTVYPLTLHTELTEEEVRSATDMSGAPHLGLLHGVVGLLPARNKRIVTFIRELETRSRVVMALSHSVDQVRALARMYRADYGPCGEITGETDDRIEQLNGFRIVFATVGVAAEAYNRPDIDTVMFLTPMRAQTQEGHVVAPALVQGGGRALRPMPGKTARVYILVDTGITQYNRLAKSMLRAAKLIGWRLHEEHTGRTRAVRSGG
ncbi:hypothetical protein EBT31_16240 [bacterium]|nr:hypothetical protein [bacterium]